MAEQVPAVEGWFTMDAAAPCLIGQRGKETGSYFFPPTPGSANPAAPFEERETVELSREGRVWSWTTQMYQPPAPYVSTEPFEPYTIVAVELEKERMFVLGQLASGHAADALKAGQAVQLVLEPLFEEDGKQHMIWKWQPVD